MSDGQQDDRKLEQVIDALAGQVQNGGVAFDISMISRSSYSDDSTKGMDLYETAKRTADADEDELYTYYEKEFLESDLAQFLVMNLVSQLMDLRFESDNPEKLKAVEDFFYSKDTEQHLVQILSHAFIYGTGIGQRFKIGTRLENVVRADTSSIQIEKGMDTKGNIFFTYEQVKFEEDEAGNYIEVPKKLNSKNILCFKPIEVPTSPYGISMMRSSLLPLQAMRQLNMDIPAGIKRLAYETMVMYLDLTGVPEEKQKDQIRKALKSFVKYDSATNTVIALDKRHELHYVGTKGSPASSKIMPILDLVEPILIFLLNKWFVPLGDVLQEKSNRALSQTQSAAAKARINALKAKFARFVEKEIIAHILNEVGPDGKATRRPSVQVKHNIPLSELKEEMDMLGALYEKGVIPREVLQQKLPFDIPDDGTYFSGEFPSKRFLQESDKKLAYQKQQPETTTTKEE